MRTASHAMYRYTYIHNVYIYTHVHTCTYVRQRVHVHTCTYMYMHTYIDTCIYREVAGMAPREDAVGTASHDIYIRI